jgi:hypothetical protein
MLKGSFMLLGELCMVMLSPREVELVIEAAEKTSWSPSGAVLALGQTVKALRLQLEKLEYVSSKQTEYYKLAFEHKLAFPNHDKKTCEGWAIAQQEMAIGR